MHTQSNSTARRSAIRAVYDALLEQKYDPIRQIRGYILSNDPTYIPDHKNARALIAEIDRTELLDDLLDVYLGALCESDEKAVEP